MGTVIKLGGPESAGPAIKAEEPAAGLSAQVSKKTLFITGGVVAAVLLGIALWFSFGSTLIPRESPETPSVSSPETPATVRPGQKIYNTNSDGNSFGD
jgi:hypothetical protein